jgi:HK97 family phage prohead protease
MIHKKTHADTSKGLTFVLSDESVDRMGDVIRASGWRVANFLKNPVALFGHDSRFIIGQWRDLRVEGTALKGRLQLAPSGTSDRIDEVRRLVAADILRAVSVGFRDIESRPRRDADGKALGGFEFLKQELVEVSMVAVPANANALAVSKALGISTATRDMVFAPLVKTDEQRRRDEYRARLRAMTPEERQAEARALFEKGRETLRRLDAADREREWEQIRRAAEDAELLCNPPSPTSPRFARYLDLLSGAK